MLSSTQMSIEMEAKDEDREVKQVEIEIKEAPEQKQPAAPEIKIDKNNKKEGLTVPSLTELAWNHMLEVFSKDNSANISSAIKDKFTKEEKDTFDFIRNYSRLHNAKKYFQDNTVYTSHRKSHVKVNTGRGLFLCCGFILLTIFAAPYWNKYHVWERRIKDEQHNLLLENCSHLTEGLYNSDEIIWPATQCHVYSRSEVLETMSGLGCNETIVNNLYNLCETFLSSRNNDPGLISSSILWTIMGVPLFFLGLIFFLRARETYSSNYVIIELTKINPEIRNDLIELLPIGIISGCLNQASIERSLLLQKIDEEIEKYKKQNKEYLPKALSLFGKSQVVTIAKPIKQQAPNL